MLGGRAENVTKLSEVSILDFHVDIETIINDLILFLFNRILSYNLPTAHIILAVLE